MTIGATSPMTNTPAGMASASGQVMGKDEFLRMLVAQLSNQDPLNPMDGQQFAAQLAQFSSVEQLINIGETLAASQMANNALARSLNSSIATGLIGQTVEAVGNHVAWDGSGEATMGFSLSAAADVTVTIRDAAGKVVRTVDLGAQEAGRGDFSWNGENDAGERLPKGTYTFSISGKTADGQQVSATTFVRGMVERVSLEPDQILLWVGGQPISMGAVYQVEGQQKR